MLAHIITMEQHAEGSKAPIQKLADQISSVFVPIVPCSCYCESPRLDSRRKYSGRHYRVCEYLIIACPCALGLGNPTAIIVGVGGAPSKGFL